MRGDSSPSIYIGEQMRKIPVTEWDAKTPDGAVIKENSLQILSILVINKKPEDMPRGFESFKLFNKLTKAFEDAEKSKLLVLEETEYKFLKNTIERDIPSNWGGKKEIVEAVDNFYNAREE